jgi:acyl-CoA synthetase (AMP-forming)/AMP-acid ligase II
MRGRKTIGRRSLDAALVLTVPAGMPFAAYAQARVTGAGLVGGVTDESGGVIPAVTTVLAVQSLDARCGGSCAGDTDRHAGEAGLIGVPCNTRLSPREMAFALDHSQARVFVGCRESYERFASAGPGLSTVEHIVLVDQIPLPAHARRFQSLFETKEATAPPDPTDPDAGALILYTSGTSAQPKGVLHTHASLHACSRLWASACELGPDERMLLTTHLMHVSGACDGPARGIDGQAPPGVEARIDAAPGRTGELLLRSPGLFAGYWRDDEATRHAFDGGCLRTGDLARVDAEGFFWFAGRCKEIIARGGANVSPQEVEETLCCHADVALAGVVGVPDAMWGESVHAVVVLKPGCACRCRPVARLSGRPPRRLEEAGVDCCRAGTADRSDRQGSAAPAARTSARRYRHAMTSLCRG